MEVWLRRRDKFALSGIKSQGFIIIIHIKGLICSFGQAFLFVHIIIMFCGAWKQFHPQNDWNSIFLSSNYLNGELIRVFNKNEVITIHIQCVGEFKSEEVVIN